LPRTVVTVAASDQPVSVGFGANPCPQHEDFPRRTLDVSERGRRRRSWRDQGIGMTSATSTDPSPLPAETAPLLEGRGISKFFGHVTALRDVDFDVRRGEVHAIVGDNGAGKSTLIKILSGAEQPSAGELYLEQERVRFATPSAAMSSGIATVHQNLALVPTMTIAENMFLGRELTRLGFLEKAQMAKSAQKMMTALKQMNITDIDVECLDLSGGQRHAVAIARGVDRASRVLILDEPTAALGVRESASVIALISDLKISGDTTIILVSHNMPEVLLVADRVTVLRNGHKVGTVDAAAVGHNQLVSMITGLAWTADATDVTDTGVG
jgi:ABC-type sugar transport system ATPase subunit